MKALPQNHDVCFYEAGRFPASTIASFLFEGLATGESVVVVASISHASLIRTELSKLRGTRAQPSKNKTFFVDTNIMADALLAGEPAENVLERNLTPSVQDAREHSSTGHIRLYGEMSDVMMRLHKPEIAMALEKFGARTAADGKTKIYCGYSGDAFPNASFARPFTRICLLHNQIYAQLTDHMDWRFRMAEGIQRARSGARSKD
jgi:hypothetical protein